MNGIRGTVAGLAIIFGLGDCAPGLAQGQTDEQKAAITIGKGQSTAGVVPDISVPQSPAFTILGLSPLNAASASTPKELAAQLLNGFDTNGNFQSGLSVDTNPFLVFNGHNVTLANYDSNRLVRTLTNTQLSLATTKGTEDADKSTRIGLGLHVTPWIDARHDPRRNKGYLGCLGTAVTGVLEEAGPAPAPGASATDRTKKIESGIRAGKQSCLRDYIEAFQNPSAWTIGLAPSWLSEDGSADDLAWAGGAIWTTLSLRLPSLHFGREGTSGQFVLHGRYRLDETVASPSGDGTFIDQDSAVAAARLRFGGNTLKASAEGAYFYTDPDSSSSDSYGQFIAGLEYRVTDGIWFEVIGGTTFGRDGEDDVFSLASIKWNFLDAE